MYRTFRHFNKNDGQHNYFGEDDYVDVQEGQVDVDHEDLDASVEDAEQNNEEKTIANERWASSNKCVSKDKTQSESFVT